MHVVERGPGVPVVLIHGFGVDHRILLPLEPAFGGDGWRRLYLDLPGMGRTPIGGVASSEDMVAEVAAAVRSLAGGEPFALVGNSFGGMIARRLAHDFREQVLGLATIAAVFRADATQRDLPERTVLRRDQAALRVAGVAAADYEEFAVVQSIENAEAFVRSVWPGLQAADEAALDRLAGAYALLVEPEEASPESFDRPCLFVAGRHDHVVGYRDAWDRLDHYPRASFAVLDAAGHNLLLDRPAVVCALVADWLARVRAEAA